MAYTTRRGNSGIFTIASLAAFAVACSGTATTPVGPTTPAAPSTTVPTTGLPGPSGGPYHLSGVIVERTSQAVRNVASAAVNLWIDQGRSGYSYWWMHGPAYSDDSGNFQLSNLPDGAGWMQAFKDGYAQQCALPVINLQTNATLQISLVARANLSADISSVPADAQGRIVSGRIVEDTPSGKRPVAGAGVDFEPVMDFPAAMTWSDADGRYLLCGLPEQSSAWIGVGLGSRVTYVSVPPGQGSDVDIVLP